MFKYLEQFDAKRERGGLQPYIGEYMYKFIIDNSVLSMIETGVSWGFSSSYFLEALKITGGDLISIEHQLMPKTSRVVPERLYDIWTIIEGDSRKELSKIFEVTGKIDLFWHDSDHSYTSQLLEYRTALPFVRYIGSHDLHRRARCAWDTFKNEVNHRLLFEDDQFGLLEVLK